MLEESAPQVASLATHMNHVAQQLEGGLEGVPELTDRLHSLLSNVEQAIGPRGERLADLFDTGESTFTSAGETLRLVTAHRSELEVTLTDLQETVSNLKAFSQEVKERPFSLIRIARRLRRLSNR